MHTTHDSWHQGQSTLKHLVFIETDVRPCCAQAALEKLFRCDDIRNGGPHGAALIPQIVELLHPMAERPSAPPVALTLLTHLAANGANRRAMAEYGAVEAVTKYLTIGPKVGHKKVQSSGLRKRQRDTLACPMVQVASVPMCRMFSEYSSCFLPNCRRV